MSSRSIATEGIGQGPLATATQGFITDDEVVLTQVNSLEGSDAFGIDSARIAITNFGKSTDEVFASQEMNVAVVTTGYFTTEVFGAGSLEELSTIYQITGLASNEDFGNSSIPRNSTGDHREERPLRLWVARRGGSSSSSSAPAAYTVSVTAESIGNVFAKNGSSRKLIERLRPLTVVAAKIIERTEEVASVDVTVDCEMIYVRKTPAIRICSERVRKAA